MDHVKSTHVLRRTLLATAAALWPRSAQSATATLDKSQLRALAEATLPESMGSAGIAAIANRFEQWVAGYKAGAELEHGYGITRMAAKPASPLTTYQMQLAGLGADFTKLSVADRRLRISEALTAAQVTALPAAPNGKHVASDLMAFWFRSSDATDICYGRAIRRYDCRGFKTASQPPALLRGVKK